ncbi:MAG: siderophore-interacting protein [Pseudomonadota bacterium]
MSTSKPLPRVLAVSQARRVTPHMIRVTFAGPELEGVPPGREGANCKLMLPEAGEARGDFIARLAEGPAPVRRTYTVRHHRPERLEMDIDFVDHGEGGPASAWARAASPGAFLGFAGPGPVKVKSFHADFYVVAADMSALPVAAATLEAMPRDARGIAVFEVTSLDDVQRIDAPEGVELRWLVHEDPHQASMAQLDLLRGLDWPPGRVQACVAGEHSTIRAFRTWLLTEKGLRKDDAYISGYWKIGLIEDAHQDLKRSEAA